MKTFLATLLFCSFAVLSVAHAQDDPRLRSCFQQGKNGISFQSSTRGGHGAMATVGFRAILKKHLNLVFKRKVKNEGHDQAREKFIINLIRMIIFRERSPGQCENLRTCRTNGFQPREDEVFLVSDFGDLPIQFDGCTERFDRALSTFLHVCEISNWPPTPYSFGDPYFALKVEFADAPYYYGQPAVPAPGIVFKLSFSFPFQMQGNPGLFFALEMKLDARVHADGTDEEEGSDFDLAAFLFPATATLCPSLEPVDVFPTSPDDNPRYFSFSRPGGLQDVIVVWGKVPVWCLASQ